MALGLPDEVDVVVVGTGAAGLGAAVAARHAGADVLVIERSSLIGGTTAVSGGVAWIPGNDHGAEVGFSDTQSDARAYIGRVACGSEPDAGLVDAFLEQGPCALRFLEQSTPLRMQAPWWYADYYAPFPGGALRGRSVEPVPFAMNELGRWSERVRRSPTFPRFTFDETSRASAQGVAPDLGIASARDEADVATRGVALVGALLKGLIDAGVEPVLETSATSLVQDESGAIVGVTGDRGGSPFRVRTRGGVVLACGGFEWNDALVTAFLGGSIHPMSPPFNTGDALLMAMNAGAALANMRAAWWYAGVRDPTRTYEGRSLILMDYTRILAGALVVNRRGQRFVNEGVGYADMPKTFDQYDPQRAEYPNAEPWLIFDDAVRRVHTIAGVGPDPPTPTWMADSDTLSGLADRVGIDRDGLAATVARFNAYAEQGIDPDFGRGTHWWEGWSIGGPDPSRSLAPLASAPFYALPLLRGVIGTNGGPLVDASANVRRPSGGTIPGLYAAGNAAASPLGTAYPGAGATIGLALTFGVLAGHAVAHADRSSLVGAVERT